MNLHREIIASVAELYWKPTIPCARSGCKVREPECSSQVLAANAEQLLICLACPQGHKLAHTSPWPARHLLPLEPVAAPAGEQPRKAAPVAKPISEPKRPAKIKAPRVKRQPKPAATTPTPEIPQASALDPRLAKLARALRELTSDGRMRVSMLDVMRCLGASNYDEAGALILQAGLRTSRLYGPVQAVLVDHNLRSLLERAAASEVRQ